MRKFPSEEAPLVFTSVAKPRSLWTYARKFMDLFRANRVKPDVLVQPLNKDEISLLVKKWRRIFSEDPPYAWFLFSYGTVVIVSKPVPDLEKAALDRLLQSGPVQIGTESADIIVTTLKNKQGYIVSARIPDVFILISAGFCSPHIAGIIGRNERSLDVKMPKIVHREFKLQKSKILKLS